MAEESQRLYRHPSWKDRKVSTVDMAWYEREFTVPREWTERRMTLSVEWLSSYARVFIDGKKVGETYYPGGEVDITSACEPGDKQVLSVLTVTVARGQRIADYLATEPAKREGVGSFRGLCGDVFLCSTPAAGNQLSDLSASPETAEGFVRLEPLHGAQGVLDQQARSRGRVEHRAEGPQLLVDSHVLAAGLVPPTLVRLKGFPVQPGKGPDPSRPGKLAQVFDVDAFSSVGRLGLVRRGRLAQVTLNECVKTEVRLNCLGFPAPFEDVLANGDAFRNLG